MRLADPPLVNDLTAARARLKLDREPNIIRREGWWKMRRRTLLKSAGVAPALIAPDAWANEASQAQTPGESPMTPNMLGAYGGWAAAALQDPPRLSFRQPMFTDVNAWRPVVRSQFRERLMGPGGAITPVVTVQQRLEFE